MSLGKETWLFISLGPSTMKSYCILSLDLDYDILYSRHYENTGDGKNFIFQYSKQESYLWPL